jgi:hypothetical protein
MIIKYSNKNSPLSFALLLFWERFGVVDELEGSDKLLTTFLVGNLATWIAFLGIPTSIQLALQPHRVEPLPQPKKGFSAVFLQDFPPRQSSSLVFLIFFRLLAGANGTTRSNSSGCVLK